MVTKLCFILFAIVPTKEQVWNKIKETGMKHPKVVFAQAVLESGTFKSPLARKCNNLFGMHIARKRPTLGKKGCKFKTVFSTYNSWEQSVEDYKLYQDYMLRNKDFDTDDAYLRYISRSYAQSSGYVLKIKKTISKNSYLW